MLSNANVPFTTILDKGYRAALGAWQAGRQLVMQPWFAKSDHKVSRQETLTLALIATDWLGNKRAVNIAKKSAFLRQGLQPNACPKCMDNVWCIWSFQVKFMFKPVL